ncbi:von Willebrand factor A domain-containing protein 3B-like [Polypterus senegalus]|uniref:von Willebrand factor A domain-containing protein 3B-like n=1 Tax=Polypterus senegalus TaxID=55291 RepID=UPI0019643A36|nr:von Willebrand factor A domain-containing protein 3B-like [Polypterus senegalus]
MAVDMRKINTAINESSFDLKRKSDRGQLDIPDLSKSNEATALQSRAKKIDDKYEPDVCTLVSSAKWLKQHGLQENKLTITQILSQIGFKHKEDYVRILQKPVSSQYAEGLFSQCQKNGEIYNIIATREQLNQIVDILSRKFQLYEKRLEWLTSGSRQIFGVIQERSITIALDFGSTSHSHYKLCCNVLCNVLKEQVSQIGRFNLICTTKHLEMWQERTAETSGANIESAVQWIYSLDHKSYYGNDNLAEAVLKAMSDITVEAIYIFVVGDIKEAAMESLRKNLVNCQCPVHMVSFNAKNESTMKFLKDLTHLTTGRFHAFAEIINHSDAILPLDFAGSNVQDEGILTQRQPVGGVPQGAGVREDVFLIWQEIEQAKKTLQKVQSLILATTRSAVAVAKDRETIPMEACLSSKLWLQKYGLKAQKVSFYDAFADCAFRHSDGIVEIKCKPLERELQSDAVKGNKLINAKYCDKFAHTLWKDGSLVHIYITAEKCSWYETMMKTVIDTLQKRLEWLQTGSREFFGNILEDQVYVLIDASESMKKKLKVLKETLHQLIQEQLQYKKKFNIVKYDSKPKAWQEKMVEVNDYNLKYVWAWVKNIEAGGSTNTLGALRLAFADPGTKAIYLLTDGRPDQPLEMILTETELRPEVPIHTISFNCDDLDANTFLYEMSQATGGRYHCYSCDKREAGSPQPFVSEDKDLLQTEIHHAKQDLQRALKLRAECVMLDWYHNGNELIQKRIHSRALSASVVQRKIKDIRLEKRPLSATSWSHTFYRHHKDGFRDLTPADVKLKDLQRQKIKHTAHTRSTLLGFIRNGVKITDRSTIRENWLLPETEEVFEDNFSKKHEVITELNLDGKRKTIKKAKRESKHSLELSSSRWLKVNSLVAKRLTILDALAPTVVLQKAKYVPVLDKHVCSKVFDEVLPLAHLSSTQKQLSLVNPQAVNLDAYKKKLELVLKTYESRLNLIVWRALTQEQRDKFSTDRPVSFQEHKEALMQALDDLGWPISPEDVSLLEDEIETGLTFLQQATDLQKAAQQIAERGTGAQEKNEEEEKNDSGKSKAAHKKILDPLKGQKVIARSEIDGFYYPGTVAKCIHSKRAIVEFKRGDVQIIPLDFVMSIGGAVPCPTLKIGDFVFVRTKAEDGGDCYVPAVVIATPVRTDISYKFYTVLKYNNKKEHSLRSGLIKISQTKYSFTSRYIRKCQMIDHTIPSVQFISPVPKLVERQHTRDICSDEEANSNKKVDRQRRKKASRTSNYLDGVSASSQSKESSSSDEGEKSHSESKSEMITEPVLTTTVEASFHDQPAENVSRPGSSLSDRIPTPVSSEHSTVTNSRVATPVETPESSNMTNKKPEDLASQLQNAITEQRSHQEQIQKYVKELLNLGLQEHSGLADQNAQISIQQNKILEKIKELCYIAGMSDERKKHDYLSAEDLPEYVRNSRHNLSKLMPGEKAICRWQYNGWYYPGTVIHFCGDQSYFVQNDEGEIERIWREDIITDVDDAKNEIKKDDPVISLHPLYPDCYCPGVILKVLPDLRLEVRYYDGAEALVPREKLFLISQEKFEVDVAYLLKCEEKWVGQPVIARNDETGTYHPATVLERVGDGKSYLISWPDGRTAIQNISFIFGRFSRIQNLTIGDFVLSLAHPSTLTFLPGVIQGTNEIDAKLIVDFCNGKRSQYVEPHLCFWLSEDQFHSAEQVYLEKSWGNQLNESELQSEDSGSVTDCSSFTRASSP